MPVHVPIALLAPQAKQVEPLRRHHGTHCATNPKDQLLKLEVLLEREVAHDLFAVLDWCYEHVPLQGREAIEEDDVSVVAIHDFMWRLVRLNDSTDEAPPRSGDFTDVRFDIERGPRPAHSSETAITGENAAQRRRSGHPGIVSDRRPPSGQEVAASHTRGRSVALAAAYRMGKDLYA